MPSNKPAPSPPPQPNALPSSVALDDVSLFVRIAQRMSLSGAARELDVPVSWVSRRLQRLEAALSARLVHRSTHGLSLTPEGEQLLEVCERITQEWEGITHDLHHKAQGASGLVRVASSANMADHLLVPSLPGLQDRHPALRVDLRVNDQLVDIAQEGIDIAIRTGPPSNDNWIVRPLGKLTRGLYASPAYATRYGLPKQAKELAHHRLITHSTQASLNKWRVPLAPDETPSAEVLPGASWQEFNMQGRWMSNNSSTMVSMALAGLGIARMPSLLGAPLVREGRLVEVMPEWSAALGLPVNAIMLAQRHRMPKVRACVDYWVEWFAALDGGS